MTIAEVTKRLIGPVEAVGETNADEKRLANLEAMIEVVDDLLLEIGYAATDKDRQEYSMKAIGQRAQKALDCWGIEE